MSAAEDDLRVGRYRIPARELSWSFGPSGGPGGQHANRAHTRAELRFDLGSSEVFPDKEWMLTSLGERASDGVVAVVVDETRSQWRNRAIARRRMTEMLAQAMRRPRPRRPTRPTRASRERRAAEKRRRSEVKRLRRPPEPE